MSIKSVMRVAALSIRIARPFIIKVPSANVWLEVNCAVASSANGRSPCTVPETERVREKYRA
jgi:hypothetical protein